jgi:serine/threonine protein kinase
MEKSLLATGLSDTAEALCLRFEAAWEEGSEPDLAAFWPAGESLALLAELIQIDQERRLKAGSPQSLEDYLQQFPALGRDRALVLDCLRSEMRLRQQQGGLALEPFVQRFPALADELQKLWGALFAGPTADFRAARGPDRADGLPDIPGYRVLRLLGKGGMGVVYEAEELALRRRVALKLLKPSVAVSAAARQRFLREAQAMGAIAHDHIVPILQIGDVRGVPFLAMPLLTGESLERRCERLGALPLDEVLGIGRQIADGLAAAHAHGLIHRDIKPANIWLEERPDGALRVKILDFGLARLTQDEIRLTQSGEIMGTPAYMAPEQARDTKGVDHRCDLFSLGCLLYQLSTGRLPFQAATTIALLRALAREEPLPPNRVNPRVPAFLSDAIMRLLRKKPQDRPAAAADVANLLREPERRHASNDTALLVPRLPPPSRRRAWILVAAAGLSGSLGLLFALNLELFQRPPATPTSERGEEKPPISMPAPVPSKRLIPGLTPDREVAERVLALGGGVTLTLPNGQDFTPVKPGELPAAFTIRFINLGSRKQLTDADMEKIGNLKRIQWLGFYDTPVSDAGMIPVERLTTLTGLWIGQTGVTGKGLATVQNLTNLIDLHLGFLPITDDDLRSLARLTRMWRLILEGTRVTDAGLAHLKGMKSLEHLVLNGTQVAGPGLEHLWRNSRFRLDMKNCKIDDAGLIYLKGFPGLFELHLNGTTVSDAGLVHLEGLMDLQTLSLDGTRVSAAGVKGLQSALPKCNIIWSRP